MTVEFYFFIAAGTLIITWSLNSLYKRSPYQNKKLLTVLGTMGIVSVVYLFIYQSVSNYEEAKNEVVNQADKVHEALMQYVESNPSDVNALRVLAEYNLELGNYDQAYKYYQDAYLMNSSNDIAIILGLIESMLLSRPEVLTYDLNELINQALAINPKDQRALWFGGLIARANGDQVLAKERWLILLEDSELSIDMRQAINEQLKLIN
jgi:cytochrome c-type biogenesis protein CcmH/NrfG